MPAKKLSIKANLDLDDLVADIILLDDQAIIEFIKSIDLHVADSDFTKQLRDYFVKETKKHDDAKKPIAPIIVAREY